jgi:hypothetical protein
MAANAKFRRAITLLTLSLLSIAGTAAAATRPNLEEVRSRFRSDGPESTNRWLNATGQSDIILDHMDRGEAGWIALANQMGTNNNGAAISESLPIALALALPHNPTAVLEAIDPRSGSSFSVDDVCGEPFIEPTRTFLRRYKRQALAAVARVQEPGLRLVKDACLAALRKG